MKTIPMKDYIESGDSHGNYWLPILILASLWLHH